MSSPTASTRTLVIAFLANLGIAASKFVAAAITGSSAMLTEGGELAEDFAAAVNMDADELEQWLRTPESHSVGQKKQPLPRQPAKPRPANPVRAAGKG